MKRIFKSMMFMAAFALSFGVLTACSEDNTEVPKEPNDDNTEVPTPDPDPEPTAVSYVVEAVIGDDATRVALNDGETLKWLDTDKVVAWYVGADGSASYALREE